MPLSLMDTHTFLWLADDDLRLSRIASKAAIDTTTQTYISVVSIWKIAIKIGNKKLEIGKSSDKFIAEIVTKHEIEILPLQNEPIIRVSTLPFPLRDHKDPFDRLLISQSLSLGIPIIRIDAKFDAYGVQRIW